MVGQVKAPAVPAEEMRVQTDYKSNILTGSTL